jgi:hypothetical protein
VGSKSNIIEEFSARKEIRSGIFFLRGSARKALLHSKFSKEKGEGRLVSLDPG